MMKNDFLLKLVFTVHVLFWVYLIFGSFISAYHAKFILFNLIPGVYILHMLKFHVLVNIEKNLIKPCATIDDIISSMRIQIPFINPFLDLQELLNKNCFLSPLNAQGMVILGAIISSRVLLL